MKILTICKDFISRLQFSKSCARLDGLYIQIAMFYTFISYFFKTELV